MTDVTSTRHRLTFQGFLVAIILFPILIIASPLADSLGFPLTSILSGAVGLMAQAFPFLIIGVLVSGAIETFVTRDFIERRFPKNPWVGMAVSLLAGFCMPVCDCATVPIFTRMLHKNIPLPSAVAFLCAAPIINPVVIWSTWFAFPNQPQVTVLRVCLGMLVAFAVGSTYILAPVHREIFANGSFVKDTDHHDRVHTITASHRFGDFLRHAHDDLFRIVPYMLAGVLLASTIRVLSGSHPPAWLGAHGTALSIVVMMALAFVSSLCSTSDAVIARGFSGIFPIPALLGFLIFGPIMDVKNIMMLTSTFTRRFIIRLACAVAVVCFAMTIALSAVLS